MAHNTKISTRNSLQRLWRDLSPKRKRQLAWLLVLMVVVSFAEVMSIAAVLPFLTVLTAPEIVFNNELARPVIALFHLRQPQDLLLPVTVAFVAAAIVAGFARISLLWAQTILSASIEADFSIQVYERTLYQPYALHVSRNSSDILAGCQKAKDLVTTIIQPTLVMLSSMWILIVVLIALLAINPVATIASCLGFGVIYLVVITIATSSLNKNSQICGSHQAKVNKAINEGLGGIRDVLLDGTQRFYLKLYRDALIPMQRANASTLVVGQSPRYGIEALGMVLIAALAYYLASTEGGVATSIPVLGVLALGAQRLLPILQNIYSSYVIIKGSQGSINDALDLLDQPMPQHGYDQPTMMAIPFKKKIRLVGLGFRYSTQTPWVINDLNLEIAKGSRVGFIGVTGSGKSTLLDIVMGLLTPTLGQVFVDDVGLNERTVRSWQAHVSHVPQSIFLADTSIAENIAFGVPLAEIDMQRVYQAAEQAKIDQTIQGWPNKYATLVGERGVRLSGGQRQRIGIARALYKQASIIIFDEATSALDNETEADVMRAIETLGSDITVLIIAHRLTTLSSCDMVVEIATGCVKSVGSYTEMVQQVA